jgi:hypothetical protein
MILNFDDKQMDYLFKVLAQRPWGEVSPLMMTISQQVQEQQDAGPRNADGPIGPTTEGATGGPECP